MLHPLIASIISVFCRPAVNCFYLISGFFIVYSDKELSINKLLSKVQPIWIRTFLCSVFLYFIFVIAKIAPFDWKICIQSFFPVMFKQYWYVTVFVLLIFIRPFWGRMLVKLSNKELGVLILVMLLFDSIQTSFGFNAFEERGYGFLHAITMLTLGYCISRMKKLCLNSVSSIIIYIMVSCIAGGVAIIQNRMFPNQMEATILLYNSPLIIISSVAMFDFFINMDIRCTFISRIAPHVFTIYLINDHPMIRRYFWKEVLHCDSIAGSNFMILHWLGCTIGFMMSGILLDYIGNKLIKYIGNHGRGSDRK